MSADCGQHFVCWSTLADRPNMDIQPPGRDRVFSILNDNDCPSFAIPPRKPSPAHKLPAFNELCQRIESSRPRFSRLPRFDRVSSASSVSSPPLLRFDSTSSAKSSNSMDSTPSPITPAFAFNEHSLAYDGMPQSNLAFLPSSGITPYLEQSMILPHNAAMTMAMDGYSPKPMPTLLPTTYPLVAQLPTPAVSADTSVSPQSAATGIATATSPVGAPAATAPPTKKNKYPCPYATSHNCTSTFTTSGHAARHGKKHTGEKGVHCPICDKAFTRKDNMKQHERTHKNRDSSHEDKKSKAQRTREAQEAKVARLKDEPQPIAPAVPVAADETTQVMAQHPQLSMPMSMSSAPIHLRKSSSGVSVPSDSTMSSNPIVTPIDLADTYFGTSDVAVLGLPDPLGADPMISAPTMPVDEVLMGSAAVEPLAMQIQMQTQNSAPAILESMIKMDSTSIAPPPPTLIRGFSELDALAQAAESVDGLYTQGGQF